MIDHINYNIEFPFRVLAMNNGVTSIHLNNHSDNYVQQVEWCIQTFGLEDIEWHQSFAGFWFKTEAAAMLFELRWQK